MKHWLFLIFIANCATLSCQKEETTGPSYFYYSVNGATCNGEFQVDGNENIVPSNVVATIIPESGDRPETVVLTYSDYPNNRIVTCYLPAKKSGPFLMTYDSDFRLIISDNAHSCSMTSGIENTLLGVSVEITHFKRESNTLKELRANFEGIMRYLNTMDEVEQHTIKGDLQFYSKY